MTNFEFKDKVKVMRPNSSYYLKTGKVVNVDDNQIAVVMDENEKLNFFKPRSLEKLENEDDNHEFLEGTTKFQVFLIGATLGLAYLY